MNRETIIEAMARAICRNEDVSPDQMVKGVHGDSYPYWHEFRGDAERALAATAAAGVRLVPVDEKPGQGWLHEAVKDACLRASKNSGGTPPQLLYAPILWAMQDALATSPYAPKDNGNG